MWWRTFSILSVDWKTFLGVALPLSSDSAPGSRHLLIIAIEMRATWFILEILKVPICSTCLNNHSLLFNYKRNQNLTISHLPWSNFIAINYFWFSSIINIHLHWSPTCLEGDLSPAPAPLLSQKSPRDKGSPGQTIIFFLLQTGIGSDMEMIVNLLGPLML